MLRRLLVTLGLLAASASGAMAATTCSDLFLNAVGAWQSLEINNHAQLTDTDGGVLLADQVDQPRQGGCDNAPCVASGSLPASIATTRPSTSNDLDRSMTLSPGDYYYDDVKLEDHDVLSLSGSGQVRIHVADDLEIKDHARLNSGGVAANLVFIVHGDVELKDHAELNALIYAYDDVRLKDHAALTGAVIGDKVRLDDHAQIAFRSPGGGSVDGLCTASTGGGGSTPPPERLGFRIEVGELTVIDTYAKPDYTRVNFTQTFAEPPVVFTLPTTDGGNAAAHRIRNVTVDGFDIMTVEPLGEDGPHVAMSLNYLAVEKGVHELPGGGKLHVGTIDTRLNQSYQDAGAHIGWETVSFGGDFSTAPAVLGQIQTMVNEQETKLPSKPSRPWLTTAISDVGAGSMKIALERSESITGSIVYNETIGYFAVEPFGRLTFLDSIGREIDMEVIRSTPVVEGWSTCNNSSTRVYFSEAWDKTPVVLATKNTRDGDAGNGEGDGGWLRRCRTTEEYVALAVDEVRASNSGDRNRRHDAAERAGVVVFSDNFVTEARQLDHFRIEHDGSGLAGSPETVTIRVCANDDCSQLYEGSVTVSLTPGNGTTYWSGSGVVANQVTFSGGSRTVSLTHNAAGTITLGLSSTPRPAQPLRCYIGAAQDCDITFAATAFEVALNDQVAATTANGSLSLAGCIDAVRGRTLSLEVAARYLDPASVGPALTVNGVDLPSDGSVTAVGFTFDNSCNAPLSVRYDEAGQVGIDLTFRGSGADAGLTIGGSDSLVFYPAALRIVAANAGGALLNASSSAATPVHPAGQAFTLSIDALNAAGAVASRYRPQANDRLLGYLRRSAPTGVGSVDSTLGVSAGVSLPSHTAAAASLADFGALGVAPAAVVGGSYTYADAAYHEVGLIALDVADSDYFGHRLDADETAIGRFVPASFSLLGSLSNRADTAGCAGSGYTYFDETLRAGITLSALTATGTTARNYLGAFARFPSTAPALYAGSDGYTLAAWHQGADMSGRLRIDAATLDSWLGGQTTLDMALTLQRGAAPDGPFDGLALGLAVRDLDNVGLGGLDLDVNGDGSDEHVTIDTTNLRYGRVALANAHGSELRKLPVPVLAQYYAGDSIGFVTHADDNCSSLAGVTLTDLDADDALSTDESCVWDSVGASGAFACATAADAADEFAPLPTNGVYRLVLAAPGAGNAGSLGVTLQVPTYLQYDWSGGGAVDPRAQATFGIFARDTRVIYQREVR